MKNTDQLKFENNKAYGGIGLAETPIEKLSSRRSVGQQRKQGVSKGLTSVARIRMRRCLNFREREPVAARRDAFVARHGRQSQI